VDQTRDFLEDQAQRYETQLASLRSFLQTLKETASKHGTDEAALEGDLTEAEHNIRYYEGELERVRAELRGRGGWGGGHVPRRPPAYDSIIPRTPRQGVGGLILASLGMLAGVLIGSQLASRKRGGS
jgi:hypothetical protein